jgi:hypothetical protein
MEDSELRTALDHNWAASDANVFEVKHRICREDAVLEYPQSGECVLSRFPRPTTKRFTVRRILGASNFWITEVILTYDRQVAGERHPVRSRFVTTVLL